MVPEVMTKAQVAAAYCLPSISNGAKGFGRFDGSTLCWDVGRIDQRQNRSHRTMFKGYP